MSAFNKLISGSRQGKRSLDRISVDRNCGNHLIEFFDSFHLIESLNNEFGQTPKNLSLD